MSIQTKLQSFVEAVVGVSISFLTGLISQLVIFPFFNIKVQFQDNLEICLWFMVISLARGYLVRRYFNSKNNAVQHTTVPPQSV